MIIILYTEAIGEDFAFRVKVCLGRSLNGLQEIADADAESIRGYKKRDEDIKVTRAGSDLKERRQERILCAEKRCARIEEFRGKCYGEG